MTQQPDQIINQPCTVCRGAGLRSSEPLDVNSEAYSQYQQSPTPPVKCHKCKGTGGISRVNPAWLRATREAAGLTRKEFVGRCGISYIYMTNLENGLARATAEHLALYISLIE